MFHSHLVCNTRRGQFEATVHKKKTRSSPAVESGLVIPIMVEVVWPLVDKLAIYITKVEKIKYPVIEGYVYNLK